MQPLPGRPWAALALWLCAALSSGFAFAADAAEVSGNWQDASIDAYRSHLQKLTAVLDACAKARDSKACDPQLVGQDDRIPVAEERRLVRYDWLRALLTSAQKKDETPAKTQDTPAGAQIGVEQPAKLTTSQLLGSARARLEFDIAQTGASAAPAENHAQAHEAMKKVLAGRDFQYLEEPRTGDTAMEHVGNAINRFFDRISRFGSRSPWIGWLFKWGFIAAVLAGLAWGVLQFERRLRIRLLPEQDGPAPDAASARDWQLWLEDARQAAAEGRWREAVHFIYWAAISRLESTRLWPADRARTPREYLALVGEDDPRKAGLATLTRSFERIWYGGRDAAEADYRAAEQTASALISSRGGPA